MKFTARKLSAKGFTLIELIVVIAILGVLAAVLITLIDPLDKINSANDAGVISDVAQFGRANDAYSATHNNAYVGGATVNDALADLETAGESKIPNYTPPAGYTVNYIATPGCTTAAGDCKNYAFWISNLMSKNYGGPINGDIYVWANGQGCFVPSSATITETTFCP